MYEVRAPREQPRSPNKHSEAYINAVKRIWALGITVRQESMGAGQLSAFCTPALHPTWFADHTRSASRGLSCEGKQSRHVNK